MPAARPVRGWLLIAAGSALAAAALPVGVGLALLVSGSPPLTSAGRGAVAAAQLLSMVAGVAALVGLALALTRSGSRVLERSRGPPP